MMGRLSHLPVEYIQPHQKRTVSELAIYLSLSQPFLIQTLFIPHALYLTTYSNRGGQYQSSRMCQDLFKGEQEYSILLMGFLADESTKKERKWTRNSRKWTYKALPMKSSLQ